MREIAEKRGKTISQVWWWPFLAIQVVFSFSFSVPHFLHVVGAVLFTNTGFKVYLLKNLSCGKEEG
jgi:hypothetical protein